MAERETLPCPACHTPLAPEATGCQICMRARTKQEIVRGYAKLRAEQARRKRRPFHILAAVVILGAGGKLLAIYRPAIEAAGGSARAALGRWADDMGDPRNYAYKSPPPPPETAPPEAAPPRTAPAAAPPRTPAAAARPARKPAAKNAWRVSGTAYDLATLEPVRGAVIIFRRDEREAARATTDEHGAYEVDLVKGGGWTVAMESPSHRRGQVIDVDPPYRLGDADERRATFDNLTDGDLAPARVGWSPARAAARLDLVAVPRRWPDDPSR